MAYKTAQEWLDAENRNQPRYDQNRRRAEGVQKVADNAGMTGAALGAMGGLAGAVLAPATMGLSIPMGIAAGSALGKVTGDAIGSYAQGRADKLTEEERNKQAAEMAALQMIQGGGWR